MKRERIKIAPGVSIYLRWQTWWVDIRSSGRRAKRSLRTSDKPEAIRLALGISAGATGPSTESLADALDRYLKDYSTVHHRPNTARRYRQVLGDFLKWVGPNLSPQQVTRETILKIQRDRAKVVSPETVNSDLTHIKAFLNWCRAEGLIEKDPCFKVKRIKVNRRKRETLTIEQFHRIVEAVKTVPYLLDFVIIAANTGMRPNEILHVRGCDLDVSKKLLSITAWGDWQTKDAEDRTIALSEDALAVLARRKMANGNDAIPLLASKTGTIRDDRNLYHTLKKRLPEDLKWVGLYEFRHFFGSEAAKAWPVAKLREYLGHADISTTLKYYVHIKALEMGPPPPIARVGNS